VYCSESDDDLLSPAAYDSTALPADALTVSLEGPPAAAGHQGRPTTASREGIPSSRHECECLFLSHSFPLPMVYSHSQSHI